MALVQCTHKKKSEQNLAPFRESHYTVTSMPSTSGNTLAIRRGSTLYSSDRDSLRDNLYFFTYPEQNQFVVDLVKMSELKGLFIRAPIPSLLTQAESESKSEMTLSNISGSSGSTESIIDQNKISPYQDGATESMVGVLQLSCTNLVGSYVTLNKAVEKFNLIRDAGKRYGIF